MASSETIKQFLVGVGFDVDEASMAEFKTGMAAAAKGAAVVAAAVAAAGAAVFAFVDGVTKELDTFSDLSLRVNASADELMKLSFVAGLADSSMEDVKSSAERVARTLGEAALGIGRGKTAFEELGFEARDANGDIKNTIDFMFEVGESVKGLDRAVQAATFEKLGISGRLIMTLTEDMSGLRAEYDAVNKALGINNDEAAQAGSDYQDSIGRLQFVVDSLFKAVGIKLIPQLKLAMDSLRQGLVSRLPQIVEAVLPVIQGVLRVGEALFQMTLRGGQFIGAIVGMFGDLSDATDGWTTLIFGAAAAWKFLNLSFLATPLGMIISLVAAIALLVDDFLTFKDGGDSLIDWTKWAPGINAAIDGMELLGEVIVKSFEIAFLAIRKVVNLLSDSFIGDAIGAVGGLLGFGGAGGGLTPSPATASAIGTNGQTVSQSTEITVLGSQDPSATGRAVADAQGRVNGDMARNLKGAVR